MHGTEDDDFLDTHVLTPSYVCELGTDHLT